VAHAQLAPDDVQPLMQCYHSGVLGALCNNACRFEDAFPGTPYDVVVDTIGGDYELRR